VSSIADVERRHIRTRLKRIVIDSRALKAAIEDEFGPDFDRARWVAAFESEEPEDVNRVSAVVGAFERIVNGLVEAARSGLVASGGSRPGGTPESVRGDLTRIRDDGGLRDAQLDLLVDLSRLRNELQHVYVEVTADMVRDGVRRLRGTLGDLLKSLNAWFGRHGVGVS
jgi:hypothetical protein